MKKTYLRKWVTKWFRLFWYLSFWYLYIGLFWHSVFHLIVLHLHCVSQSWPALEITLSLLFLKNCSGSLPSIRMKGGHRLCRNCSVMLMDNILSLLDTELLTTASIPGIEKGAYQEQTCHTADPAVLKILILRFKQLFLCIGRTRREN